MFTRGPVKTEEKLVFPVNTTLFLHVLSLRSIVRVAFKEDRGSFGTERSREGRLFTFRLKSYVYRRLHRKRFPSS